MSSIDIFAVDEHGRRTRIDDLYWFEENSVHSLDDGGVDLDTGTFIRFEVVVDGFTVWPTDTLTDAVRNDLLEEAERGAMQGVRDTIKAEKDYIDKKMADIEARLEVLEANMFAPPIRAYKGDAK